MLEQGSLPNSLCHNCKNIFKKKLYQSVDWPTRTFAMACKFA
nr:unnamed protein product [Callosobruchus chinensis]